MGSHADGADTVDHAVLGELDKSLALEVLDTFSQELVAIWATLEQHDVNLHAGISRGAQPPQATDDAGEEESRGLERRGVNTTDWARVRVKLLKLKGLAHAVGLVGVASYLAPLVSADDCRSLAAHWHTSGSFVVHLERLVCASEHRIRSHMGERSGTAPQVPRRSQGVPCRQFADHCADRRARGFPNPTAPHGALRHHGL
ncbi:hypothetical protein KFE25_007515 [Diacronema lutheri]|uniref:Uncharacterized protein n=1 Tax=Diacronema lutheri TaxID=2081491 RepID=A0A8J6CBP7_DIALT|nr:hypothetical protein KFE25_007515 [Diacronema lutheri]